MVSLQGEMSSREGRGSLGWVGRVGCEEHTLPSAAGCLQIHLGHPATVTVNGAAERALMSPTETKPQRDDHVLKLLEVLLLLKQALAFKRTMVATWLSVLAVKEHLLHLVTCGCSHSWVSKPSSLPPVFTNWGLRVYSHKTSLTMFYFKVLFWETIASVVVWNQLCDTCTTLTGLS